MLRAVKASWGFWGIYGDCRALEILEGLEDCWKVLWIFVAGCGVLCKGRKGCRGE